MNLIVVIETNKDATTLFQGCLLFISLTEGAAWIPPKSMQCLLPFLP